MRTAAETLARRGYRFFATMRDTSGRNAAIAEDLRALSNGERWTLGVLDMDVTDEASVNKAVREALDRAVGIDVVINNAEIATRGITGGFTVEQYQQVLDVNLFGVVRVNRAVLRAMRRQVSGFSIPQQVFGVVSSPCLRQETRRFASPLG